MPADSNPSVCFVLNGKEVDVEILGDEPLLYALRNRFKLKATHFGCGLEQCGSCTVSVNGAAHYACTLPVADLLGAQVVTAEALPDDPVGASLLRAFEAEQAGQCGYCLSGILMSAYTLLKEQSSPDRGQIIERLDRHLCRCGAHAGIVRAVERAASDLAKGRV